jgi:signal transduction histidine kinase
MKIKFAALLFIICITTHKSIAQYVWFSGYSYNAPFLLNQKKENLFDKSFNKNNWRILNNEISLANFYWLNRDYYGCKQHLLIALAFAEKHLTEPDLLNFSIKVNHLIWERALFEGRWEEALDQTNSNKKFIHHPLGYALYQYQTYTMMTKGDVVFIASDKKIISKLRQSLIELNLHRMALSIAMQEYQNNFINKEELSKFVNKLPEPIIHVGELELYYQTHSNSKMELLKILNKIPRYDYISNFRAGLELMKFYASEQKKDSFYYFQKKIKLLTNYLADADAENHYNTTLISLFEQHHIAVDSSLLIHAKPWRTDARVKYYNYYNNQRIEEVNQRYLKQLNTTKWLLTALLLATIALVVVLYKIVKSQQQLKRLNQFRNQFVFALSHDLNATLTALEQHTNQHTEALLIEHRMMLDDTLLWAQSASKNKGISNEICSLSDLVHETMEQLNSLILLKKFTVTWLGDIDEAITINKNAMLVVVRNTLLNTIKHNTQQGFITIDVQASKITLTNSTIHATQSQSKTGSFLINYFTAINNATYAIHINNNVAYTTISIKH